MPPSPDERREAAIEAAFERTKPTGLAGTLWVLGREQGNCRAWFRAGFIAAYDAALGGHEPERLAAIEACDSVRELIVRFAKVGDKQAGEWLDRHLKTIRSALDRAALGGEAEGRQENSVEQLLEEVEELWSGPFELAMVEHIWTAARRSIALSEHPEPSVKNSGVSTPIRGEDTNEGSDDEAADGPYLRRAIENLDRALDSDWRRFASEHPHQDVERERVPLVDAVAHRATDLEAEVERLREALHANLADAEETGMGANKACRLIADRARAALASSPELATTCKQDLSPAPTQVGSEDAGAKQTGKELGSPDEGGERNG